MADVQQRVAIATAVIGLLQVYFREYLHQPLYRPAPQVLQHLRPPPALRTAPLHPHCLWLDHIGILSSRDQGQEIAWSNNSSDPSTNPMLNIQVIIPTQPQSSWVDHISAIHMRQLQRHASDTQLPNVVVMDNTTAVALILLLVYVWRRRLCFTQLKSCINKIIRFTRWCLAVDEHLIDLGLSITSVVCPIVLFMALKALNFDDPTQRIQHLLVIADRENLSQALGALEAELEQNKSASDDAIIKHNNLVSGLNRHISQETDRANAKSEEARHTRRELEELRTKHVSVIASKGSLETQLADVRQQMEQEEAEHATNISGKATQITTLDLALSSEKDRVASLLQEREAQSAKIAELTSASTSAETQLAASRRALAAERHVKALDAELHASQLQGKDCQIEELNRRIEALNATVSKAEKDVARAQKELQMMKGANEVTTHSLEAEVQAKDTRIAELEHEVTAQDAAMQVVSLNVKSLQDLVEVNDDLLRAANERGGRLEWRNMLLEREVETMRNGMRRPTAFTATAAEQDPMVASGKRSPDDDLLEQPSSPRAHPEPTPPLALDVLSLFAEESPNNSCDLENTQVSNVQTPSSIPLANEGLGSHQETIPEGSLSAEEGSFLGPEASSSSLDESSPPIEPVLPITASLNSVSQNDELTRDNTPSPTQEEGSRQASIPIGMVLPLSNNELAVSEVDREEIHLSEEALFVNDSSASSVDVPNLPLEAPLDCDFDEISPAAGSASTTAVYSSGPGAPSCKVPSESSERSAIGLATGVLTSGDQSLNSPHSSNAANQDPRSSGSIGSKGRQRPRLQLKGSRSTCAAAFTQLGSSASPLPRPPQQTPDGREGVVAPVTYPPFSRRGPLLKLVPSEGKDGHIAPNQLSNLKDIGIDEKMTTSRYPHSFLLW